MADNGRREAYGEPEAHPCRWEPGARLVRTAEGKQQVCEGTLWTTARLTPKDLFWLPGNSPEDYGASRRALNAYERKGLETGEFDHSEVVV
nr:hypothetical protein [Archangium primigenium]